MKYKKKPVVVDVYHVTTDISQLKSFVESLGDRFDDHFEVTYKESEGTSLKVNTLEGTSYDVVPGRDVIIRGVKGEYYPCRKDIFEDTYQLA